LVDFPLRIFLRWGTPLPAVGRSTFDVALAAGLVLPSNSEDSGSAMGAADWLADRVVERARLRDAFASAGRQ